MISNFKLIPQFNISQIFFQNVRKTKKNFYPELFTLKWNLLLYITQKSQSREK